MVDLEAPGGIPRSFQHIGKQQQRPMQLKRTYVDWGPFYDGGRHVLLQGRTGSGKTTTLLNFLWKLHNRGHRILLRDDGGLDFLYLAEYIPMTVWVPMECVFTLGEPEKYDIVVRQFRDPTEILDEAYTSTYRFHAVLYDCYCNSPGPAADFYSEMFRELIFRCMQTARYEKDPLVFSFDELNDLIQPRGMEITSDHTSIRGMVEYNIRKLRKHRVTLFASTHRFNQIGINVRSQFSYIMIKQSYGKDVYDFISHNLITAANEGFWATMRALTTMGPEYAYVFDYKNNYDKLRIPDIPRPTVKYRINGQIIDTEDAQQYDMIDLLVLAARVKDPPDTYRVIGDRVGRAKQTIAQRVKKLRDVSPFLMEAMQ